jgi:hypothetical protein
MGAVGKRPGYSRGIARQRVSGPRNGADEGRAASSFARQGQAKGDAARSMGLKPPMGTVGKRPGYSRGIQSHAPVVQRSKPSAVT